MYITKSMMFTPLFKFSFTCRSSPGPSPEDQTYIFGDSLTKLLYEDWESSDTKFFSCPGATIHSLQEFIRSLTSCSLPTPKTIILHVGTNSLKKTSLRQARQQFMNIAECARTTFQCPFSSIAFSPILPRWDCDFLYQRSLQFNGLLQSVSETLGCRFVNFSQELVAEELYAVDGLHLTRHGYAMFAELLEQSIKPTKCAVTLPWMVPPLTRQWTAKELVKRRKKAGHVRVAEVPKTSTNSRPKTKLSTVKPRQPHKSAGRQPHTPHKVQIGCFVRVVLPIPHRIPVMGTRVFQRRTSKTDLPSAAKPYIEKKRAGKAKQRQRKRTQKRRSQKRSRKVCQNFTPIL